MKYQTFTVALLFIASIFILQSHSDGRATRDRDNTGAPGSQSGANGSLTTCQHCHANGNFEVSLNLELLDANNNTVTEYIPNLTYTAKVTINTLSGDTPNGYGFQMVSLFDEDDSDVNGWVDAQHSSNVHLVLANSTGRVYAEQPSTSASNEFTAVWTAPEPNSGDVSFYISGVGVDGNGSTSGDYAPIPIKTTFSETSTTSTSDLDSNFDLNIYPNPTSSDFNITGDLEHKTIEIYQYSKMLQSIKTYTKHIILPFREFDSGLYIIVIKDGDNQILASKKIVRN